MLDHSALGVSINVYFLRAARTKIPVPPLHETQ